MYNIGIILSVLLNEKKNIALIGPKNSSQLTTAILDLFNSAGAFSIYNLHKIDPFSDADKIKSWLDGQIVCKVKSIHSKIFSDGPRILPMEILSNISEINCG